MTKDLSRLGRNYIEAGGCNEVFVSRCNVRYIAVTDGVDSLNRQEMGITPFKNILNALYSRDMSKKVLVGWMAQGKSLGGPTPYGLRHDPDDCGHLIIDPKTAPTVNVWLKVTAIQSKSIPNKQDKFIRSAGVWRVPTLNSSTC